MNDDLEKDVVGWVQSESMDEIAGYASRGRKYAELSNDEAVSQWVQAFRSLANDFVKSPWWHIQSDLTSELSLRGLEPPYEMVREDIEKLSKGLTEAAESNLGNEAAGESALDRFRAFRAKQSN